ncbi:MAG: hypothetical protein CR984_03265 [Proteobacteria bacterium]|nr:MAG: hypothetical protein CR984_03265 [Pseudomonadota bacterium]PIE67506.1 MAG: hypothetical protein CSA23_03510 [Deltaproteobacteria bacterium]
MNDAKTVMVTGSAGYIGSHACLQLLEAGYRMVGMDNDSRGNRGATEVMRQFDGFSFVKVNIRDVLELVNIFKQHGVDDAWHWSSSNPDGFCD